MKLLLPASLWLGLILTVGAQTNPPPLPPLTADQASRFAGLALGCIHKEYPNKLDHVMNDAGEVRGPRELHPAFYGCFDWHSSVHGHWMLVRLLRQFPELPNAGAIRAGLDRNLTARNLELEVAYLGQRSRGPFERTYGWAWLLKLAEELRAWDDPQARRWSTNLAPLAEAMVQRYLDFLPRQTYPIRTGVHPNTAFGLAFAFDYAQATGNPALAELVRARSRDYFGGDANYPATLEPGGEDFFSPALLEADLMRRVLPAAEFQRWFQAFLPKLAAGEPATLLSPAIVSDRSDPKLVHLDGLNLSRAWCLRNLAAALPADDPRRGVLARAAAAHTQAGLVGVTSGDYAGEHWLGTFAVFLLSGAQ
jgi:hypothetical protein